MEQGLRIDKAWMAERQYAFQQLNEIALNSGNNVTIPEMDKWAAENVEQAQLNLEKTLPLLQKETHKEGRKSFEQGAEIFCVMPGASSKMAEAVVPAGCAVLDSVFVEKDWNVPGEISGAYNPKTDLLVVTVNHANGQPDVMSAMHSKPRITGELLHAEKAIQDEQAWGTDYVAALEAANLRNLVGNKKVLEVMTIATLGKYAMSPAAIAEINTSSITTIGEEAVRRELTAKEAAALMDAAEMMDEFEYYIACLDEPAGKMLNRKGDGFKNIGLPFINFEARKPDANNTGVYVCDGPAWRRNMLDPDSPSYDPRLYHRFWSRNNPIAKRFALTYVH